MHKQTRSLHAAKCKIRPSFSTVKEFDVEIRKTVKTDNAGNESHRQILNFPLLHTLLVYPRVFVFYLFFLFLQFSLLPAISFFLCIFFNSFFLFGMSPIFILFYYKKEERKQKKSCVKFNINSEKPDKNLNYYTKEC